jgi:hypothetical protein
MEKTKTWVLITLIGMLLLSACSSGAGAAATSSAAASDPDDSAVAPQVPLQTRLALGTLMLKGTANEVTSDQAAELLVLWKAIQSLTSSDTTAPEEIAALYEQIQETMTPEQNAALAAMDFSRENMAQIAQELGLNLGGPGGGALENLTPEMQATMEARRASREAAGGGMAAGGPGMPGGGFEGGPPPEFNAAGAGSAGTQDGSTAPNRAGFGGGIVQAVIDYLQTR